MECTVEKVTPFTQELDTEKEPTPVNAVASVTLGLGPVRLQARLFKRDSDERMWLQMPGRKVKDDKWFDYIVFRDHSLFKQVEQRAVDLYKTTSPN